MTIEHVLINPFSTYPSRHSIRKSSSEIVTHSLIALVIPKALYLATISIQKSNQSVYTSIEANLSSLYNLAHVKSCDHLLYSCSYISVGGTTYLIKLLSERLNACHQCHLTCEQHLNSTLFSFASMLFWHEVKV